MRHWTTFAPILAIVVAIGALSTGVTTVITTVVTVLLFAAVLAAVQHADVIAHRVGEPFGSLILAVAVTIIEVALIVTMMAGGGQPALARDTAFAAVIITCNGIVGLSLFAAARRGRIAGFRAEGSGAALATVATLTTLTLVLPTFTTSEPGPEFSSAQLAFAGIASLALYALFVTTQTVRHREDFLPLNDGDTKSASHAPAGNLLVSLPMLVVALVAVVLGAKVVSKPLEKAIDSAGLPEAVVGVIIAMLVLLPETLTALRAALRDQVQISLNLAYGSAMASIGLTIPTIAVASIWLDGRLLLGLDSTHMVLLALTVGTGILTVTPGRATLLQGGVHLAIFAAFLFLAFSP